MINNINIFMSYIHFDSSTRHFATHYNYTEKKWLKNKKKEVIVYPTLMKQLNGLQKDECNLKLDF